jgi:hypothetical protein
MRRRSRRRVNRLSSRLRENARRDELRCPWEHGSALAAIGLESRDATWMCQVDARPHRRLSAALERRSGDAGSTHHPEATMRAPIRPVRLGPDEGVAESRPDGSVILRVKEPLGAYPRILTDRLVEWAHARPDQIFLRMRTPTHGLVALSYRQTLDRVVDRAAGDDHFGGGCEQDRRKAHAGRRIPLLRCNIYASRVGTDLAVLALSWEAIRTVEMPRTQ